MNPELDASTLCDTIELVTSVTLGLHANPTTPPDPTTWAEGDEVWTGCVAVTGGFRGAITLSCKKAFAYRATRAMLDTDEVDDSTAGDVLSELTNVIGGNIKSLLASTSGEHASLSVPMLNIGRSSVHGTTVVQEQWCDLDGDRIVVALLVAR